jgi:hypothetical protein
MTPPDQERLDGISESLVRLLRRQDELESRVRQLESTAAVKAAPQATAGPWQPVQTAQPAHTEGPLAQVHFTAIVAPIDALYPFWIVDGKKENVPGATLVGT